MIIAATRGDLPLARWQTCWCWKLSLSGPSTAALTSRLRFGNVNELDNGGVNVHVAVKVHVNVNVNV